MSPRFRKLLGAFVMIAFVLVYALVAMAVADSRPMHEAPAYPADPPLHRAGPRLGAALDAAGPLDGGRRSPRLRALPVYRAAVRVGGTSPRASAKL